ncbi:MAG TPA: hypothetical protein VGR89_16030, partial [Puia sp.]|nr:hypothetical protein [Puia sp.]
MKAPILHRGLLIAVMTILMAAAAFCGYQAHTLSARAEKIRTDYSATNNISYGILSVNRWRDLIVAAVSKQIQSFQLSPEERDSLEKEITVLLNGLVDKGDSAINAPKKTLGGKIRQLAYHTFVKKRKLHRLVPEFSQKITTEILKPKSKRRLKYLAENKLEEIGSRIYDSSLAAQQKTLDSIYRQYHLGSDSAFQKYTEVAIPQLMHRTYWYSDMMVLVVLVVLG